MAEDYTYEPVTDVTSLAARVQELETALAEQCELAATLMQQRTELEAQLNAAIVGGAQLERENAELRAKLNAVPTASMARLLWGDATLPGYVNAVGAVGDWLIAEEAVQP